MAAKRATNTILCISILAGSIALATSTFRIYEMIFASTVPYANSDRMVILERKSSNGHFPTDWPMRSYRLFTERQSAYQDILAFHPDDFSVQKDGVGYLVNGAYIDVSMNRVLGVQPIVGRGFVAADANPDSTNVALISFKLWQRLFQGDPDVQGRTLTADSVVRTIIGVMPEGFDGPYPEHGADFWVPLNPDDLLAQTGGPDSLNMIGVLKPDVSFAEASRQTSDIVAGILKAFPQDNYNTVDSHVRPMNSTHADDGAAIILEAVFACAFLVLLMACGIVSGLVTAKFSARTQEVAIRSALGASRVQIVTQMIVEFFVISIPAVLLGLLLSRLFEVTVLVRYYVLFGIPEFMLQHNSVRNGLFIVAVLSLVTLVSTIMPALRASRIDLGGILHESTRTGSSLRVTKLSNFLIAFQVATAFVVMSGGAMVGFFIHDYNNFSNTFDPKQYIAARIAFNARDHRDISIKRNEVTALRRKLEQNPNIEEVCLTNEFFFGNQWCGQERPIWVEGKDYVNDYDPPVAFCRIVTPGYMKSFHIPILAGRDFTEQDDDRVPSAIVTEGFAREIFGSTDVLGRRFKMSRYDRYLTVVGVVPKVFNPSDNPSAHYGFFRTYAEEPWDDMFVVIKGRGSVDDLRRIVTGIAGEVDGRICVTQFLPYMQTKNLGGPASFLSFLLTLFTSFSICALVMTVGGLYGIISFSVNARRIEIGIRLALGAKPQRLVIMLTRHGLLFVFLGMMVGAACSVLLRQAMMRQFFALGGTAWAFAAVAFVLIGISGLAVLIPACGIARLEPASALRE